MVRRGKGLVPGDGDRNHQLCHWTAAESQPGVGLTTPGQNDHHRPGQPAEHAGECGFIRGARFGTLAGMRVNPHPAELFERSTEIDLFVEVIRHRLVVEFDRDAGRPLWNQSHVGDAESILGRADAEPTDFGVTPVPQKQQFAPGPGREP